MSINVNRYSEWTGPVLSMHGINKYFAGIHALKDVDFDIHAGEILALIGENGAGKSTLMKMLGGIHQPDSGEIRLAGRSVEIPDVRSAIALGIGFIHQELNVLDNLDIAGNIFLGREPTLGGVCRLLNRKQLHGMAESYLQRLGVNLSPATPMKRLTIAQQQIVEIAKALSLDARVLIMDEPTSSLSYSETEILFETVRTLQRSGVSIVYISHRLHEIITIADRVIGLRDGANSGELTRNEITHENMVRLMVGRDIKPHHYGANKTKQKARLRIDRLRTRAWPSHELSFEVAAGEILGITGLVGSGRTELACALFGIDPPVGGSISLDGKEVHISSASDAVRNGIVLVPEDRRSAGLITEMTVVENLTLPRLAQYARFGILQKKREALAAQAQCQESNIRVPNVHICAKHLSGGNQQKTVLAKWLSCVPRIIILDEPTRGIDVASKAEVYVTLRHLRDHGIIVLMISSDMEEVISVSDRIVVMHEGQITGILAQEECTEQEIMNLAVGKMN
jgi:ribose transport system ATP-binding protein